MSTSHVVIEDDALSFYDSGDLSFVGDNMDDFFDFGLPSSESSSGTQSPEPPSQQSPAPTSQSLFPIQSTFAKMPFSSGVTATLQRDYPRTVSVDSMSQVMASPAKHKVSKATPLQSLKELVSSKQQQKQSLMKNNLKRPASLLLQPRSTFESRISSLFEKPSLVLRQIVEQKAEEELASKRRKLEPCALHQVCRRATATVQEVESILARDPEAASRPVSLSTSKRVYDPITNSMKEMEVKETYRYPLNLAIQYQASAPVLERLVAAAPAVLTMTEGRDKLTPLHVLLQHKPSDDVSADMMLLKHPDIASICDAKANTPLHQAVARGASEQIVRHLVILNPDALMQRNFHRHSPLDMAQRGGKVCSNQVVDYLWGEVQNQF